MTTMGLPSVRIEPRSTTPPEGGGKVVHPTHHPSPWTAAPLAIPMARKATGALGQWSMVSRAKHEQESPPGPQCGGKGMAPELIGHMPLFTRCRPDVSYKTGNPEMPAV